ncbi:hypothetical protein OHA40_10220 [Nocardia sp. NBC_00508]|uniref:hypothetical protein n=1 Tax=Nocardia sp. NBC_00508 TaxID=2975992 RepID=UPI002E7FD5BD|nr:hypothetical protein [Nocardia sp. NBC_00508]WUD68442.1 hypothetical protein OHA40_10220 [Nocardia sp. NBC_00508]
MWEWSKTVAEYAAAAAWTHTQAVEAEPKYGEPETWSETAVEAPSAEGDGVRTAARDPILGEYDLVG